MTVSDDVRKKYIPTIGIETHVQLKTKSKLFSAVGNDARNAAPNSLISHIDVGMPGALPVLNQAAIELACKAAFALNTSPQKFSKFDRKHYFYPDLPKGYQITQYENPIIKGGYVEFYIEGEPKKIEITRVHLEEDAGKNTHPAGADYSLVDLNRAGTPLLEIVSEPQIHSPAEAKAFARELYLLMKYANVSDVDLYHGNLRFDVNISVSKDPNQPGKRAEIKNLNSFRSVENAVAFEIDRQIELYEKGQEVVQETRGWDEAKQKTISQRGKEEAHDYRYMPEPDIPPIELDDKFIEKIKSNMPDLPNEIRQWFSEMEITIQPKIVEDILDNPEFFSMIKEVYEISGSEMDARRAAFLLLDARQYIYNSNGILRDNYFNSEIVIKISEMLNNQQIIWSGARLIFREAFLSGKSPTSIAEANNLLQSFDESEIEEIVVEVLDQNPQAAQDVKRGEMKAIGFLVGQVMAKSHGKANPQLTQQIIKRQLGI